MVKNLRSLLHERFPLDLRVKIELLSRRRDITNKEKQEELFKLLREFKINDIVPLGPGTNRYAFKVNGYVIKVATDHDGKIDNLKEFKMAKRLFPYVTKTYEVSENGTLLVAEYIQPFSSYTEMCMYAEKIRTILRKLSSVYLIGDVGITPKNYANWGLRVGSDEPVCLDFAYVYDVSSDLFVCRECKTNSMLLPDNDFTYLYCPAKGCGKKYLFEDIRRRIGNDLHRHEIGDLAEEGYLLTESNVPTELTEERSNYLRRKKVDTVDKIEHIEAPVELDNFELEYEPDHYIQHKEDLQMNGSTIKNAAAAFAANGTFAPVIKAKAWSVNDIKGKVERSDGGDDGLAFSGSIGGPTPVIPGYIIPNDKQEVIQLPDPVEEELPEPEDVKDPHEESAPEVNDTAEPSEAAEPPKVIEATLVSVNKEEEEPAEATAKNNAEEVKQPAKNPDANRAKFSDSFIRNAERCVSKLSNRIGAELHQRGVFDDVRMHIMQKKMFAEPFYTGVQNAVYRSLIIFCEFTEEMVPNANNNGTRRTWKLGKSYGVPFEPTLAFLERIWNIREINKIEDSEEMMKHYRELFDDYQGIQREWIPVFVDRLTKKMRIDKAGAEKVGEAIAALWCVPDVNEVDGEPTDPYSMENVNPELRKRIEEEVSKGFDGVPTEQDVHDALRQAAATGMEKEDKAEIRVEEEAAKSSEEEGVAFSETLDTDEDADEDENDEESAEPLSVEIYPEDDFDIIRIKTSDAFGVIEIPIYARRGYEDQIPAQVPSMVDDRNGVWDWLVHIVPDIMFKTTDPDYWLRVNNVEPAEDKIHIVILDEEEDGTFIMGIYYLLGVYVIDEDGASIPTFDNEVLSRINRLIVTEIGNGYISHLRRTLSQEMKDLIHDEDYVRGVVGEAVEFDEDESEEEETMDMDQERFESAEQAAIAAIMGGSHAPVVPASLRAEVSHETAASTSSEGHQVFRPLRRQSAVAAENN